MKVKNEFEQLSVFVTTYNCGESKPTLEVFHRPDGFLSNYNDYDMLVIGLQECYHLLWVTFVRKYIPEYYVVSSVSMWKVIDVYNSRW